MPCLLFYPLTLYFEKGDYDYDILIHITANAPDPIWFKSVFKTYPGQFADKSWIDTIWDWGIVFTKLVWKIPGLLTGSTLPLVQAVCCVSLVLSSRPSDTMDAEHARRSNKLKRKDTNESELSGKSSPFCL